jgi:precorrin-8X/cobalt-precorrin-8 methylmutase
MPFFLFGGKHSAEDIPRFIDSIRAEFPLTDFTITSALGGDRLLAELTVKRIREALPDEFLSDQAVPLPAAPSEIEARSMMIIDQPAPAAAMFLQRNLPIKRVVHAAGDVNIADLIRFRENAIPASISAIQRGRPIMTDVKMAAAGINRKKAPGFGCKIQCAIEEPGAASLAEKEKITLAAASFRLLQEQLNDSIVVIGNAPTALFALLEAVDSGSTRPAVIIGMPVGFVGAGESKAELLKRDIPSITLIGNRGGSGLAAAAANALLNLA